MKRHISFILLISMLLCGCSGRKEGGKWKETNSYTYYAHESRIFITDENKDKVYWVEDGMEKKVNVGKKIYNGLRGPVMIAKIPVDMNPFEWKPSREDGIDCAMKFYEETAHFFYLKKGDDLEPGAFDHELLKLVNYYYSSYNDRLRGMRVPTRVTNTNKEHRID